MKHSILKPFPPVEPQSPAPEQRHTPVPATTPATPAPTSLVDISSRGSQPCADPAASILFIGMDVHNDSIAVSLASSDSTEVRRYGVIGGTHDDVLKLLHKLQAAHPSTQLRVCYEAGPRG